MSVSYDTFTSAFLDKVKEYDFLELADEDRTAIVDGYMKRACAQFNKICKYDLVTCDDDERVISDDIEDEDLEEIVDIVTDGMLVQWFKPYMYKQENYENMLNTTDFSSYSPAELLYRVTNAYDVCKREYRNRIKEYSYSHADLSDLHI